MHDLESYLASTSFSLFNRREGLCLGRSFNLLFAGDATRDGSVDMADLTILLANWTGALPPGEGSKIFDQADFDFNGAVDMLDLTVLLAGWTGASAAVVPEPAAGLSWLMALAAIVAWQARRSRRLGATRRRSPCRNLMLE